MNEARCRICLEECHNQFSIFTRQGDLSPYEKLIQLKLLQDDVVEPCFICSQCLYELDICVKFFEKCEISNRTLSSLVCSSLKSNDTLKPESGDLDKQVNNVVEDLTSNDFDALEREESVTKSCSECGSKRNCKHKPQKLYTCQFCSKVFTKKFNCDIHIKRHLGLREWPCPTCGSPQVSSWHAKHHCVLGTRFVCPAPGCTRSYTSAHNLTVHIRNHTGDRPYECDECGKRFTSKTTLTDHIKTHTGVKPYMCSICGARFATNKLMAHLKTHSRTAKPHRRTVNVHVNRSQKSGAHACQQCSMRYSHKQSLNRHLRKCHSTRQERDVPEDSNLLMITTNV